MDKEFQVRLRTARINCLIAAQSSLVDRSPAAKAEKMDAYAKATKEESALIFEAFARGYTVQEIGDAQQAPLNA